MKVPKDVEFSEIFVVEMQTQGITFNSPSIEQILFHTMKVSGK